MSSNDIRTLTPLSAELREPLEREDLDDVWKRVAVGRQTRKRAQRRRRTAMATVPGIAALVGLAIWLGVAGSGGGALDVNGQAMTRGLLAAPVGSDVVRLSDGSQITLAPEATLEVLDNSARTFGTYLRRGTVHFNVRPGGPRLYSIDAGNVRVEVIGTEFDVERTDSTVRVSVFRGVVLVRSASLPEGVRRLEAGDKAVVHTSSAALAKASTGSTPSSAPVAALDSPVLPVIEPTSQSPAIGVRARATRVAERTETSDSAAGLAPSSPQSAPEDDLTRLLGEADEARAARSWPEATRLLHAIATLYANDSRAALAEFTAAKVEMDHLEAYSLAANSFARSVEMRLPRALVEEAWIRRARSLELAGQKAEAARIARQYLGLYSTGSRRAEALALVSRAESL